LEIEIENSQRPLPAWVHDFDGGRPFTVIAGVRPDPIAGCASRGSSSPRELDSSAGHDRLAGSARTAQSEIKPYKTGKGVTPDELSFSLGVGLDPAINADIAEIEKATEKLPSRR
jgi:hypothetical protein